MKDRKPVVKDVVARPLYQELASTLDAYKRCQQTGNTEWEQKHLTRLRELELNALPRGGGIDPGVKIDLDASTPNKLVLTTSFHHMTEGMYNGWTDHTITVRPSLIHGFTLTIIGSNRNDIKEYLHEVFQDCLARLDY